ncbi:MULTISPECIES: hypothetical protein [Bradyrhizobium]|uniref:Antitoxin Xre/MbcA/ParS-like middle domain-containing protein n=1 Tax=Bradyrhizobium septentrionale TaxID=1404411 RepID=A0ABZ2P315_9BRAD
MGTLPAGCISHAQSLGQLGIRLLLPIVLGAGELVNRLNISRGTLDNWRKANKIIALRKGLRNFLYPLRQFERRRPVEGLDVIAPFFTSPEETWEWLVSPNRMTSGKPPIDKLRDGDLPLVAIARKPP